VKLASELVVDAVVPGERLRSELLVRLERATESGERTRRKKHIVPPV
jgi:acetyl-CoA carboxylase carboxyltransferase component